MRWVLLHVPVPTYMRIPLRILAMNGLLQTGMNSVLAMRRTAYGPDAAESLILRNPMRG